MNVTYNFNNPYINLMDRRWCYCQHSSQEHAEEGPYQRPDMATVIQCTAQGCKCVTIVNQRTELAVK